MPHEILIGIAKNVVVVRAVFGEIELRLLEDADQVCQFFHHRGSFAKFIRVVEVGEITAGEPGVGVDERLDDLGIDLVANVGLALEGDHIFEARTLGDRHRRGEILAVTVLVGDVFDEQHEQDVILVLAGIHAAPEFIARGPEGGVKVGFFNGHESRKSVRGRAGVGWENPGFVAPYSQANL